MYTKIEFWLPGEDLKRSIARTNVGMHPIKAAILLHINGFRIVPGDKYALQDGVTFNKKTSLYTTKEIWHLIRNLEQNNALNTKSY